MASVMFLMIDVGLLALVCTTVHTLRCFSVLHKVRRCFLVGSLSCKEGGYLMVGLDCNFRLWSLKNF